jgi:hypothetical protein
VKYHFGTIFRKRKQENNITTGCKYVMEILKSQNLSIGIDVSNTLSHHYPFKELAKL